MDPTNAPRCASPILGVRSVRARVRLRGCLLCGAVHVAALGHRAGEGELRHVCDRSGARINLFVVILVCATTTVTQSIILEKCNLETDCGAEASFSATLNDLITIAIFCIS